MEIDSISGLLLDRVRGSDLNGDDLVREYFTLLFMKGLYIRKMTTCIREQDREYFSDQNYLFLFGKNVVLDIFDKDYSFIPQRLWNDKEFIMKALRVSKRSVACYPYLSEHLKLDSDIVLAAVGRCASTATILPYDKLDFETTRKICSLVTRVNPKSIRKEIAFDTSPTFEPIFALLDKGKKYFEKENVLKYYTQKDTNISRGLNLIFEFGLHREIIQIIFFKRKKYGLAVSVIEDMSARANIDFDCLSIFNTDQYPAILTAPIEKLPLIGKGTFTLYEILSTSIGKERNLFEIILDQLFTKKHLVFFLDLMRKGKFHPHLVKLILYGEIKEKVTNKEDVEEFLNDVFADKRIVKTLIAQSPEGFKYLPNNLKTDKEIIDIAYTYPANLEFIGKTDENYLEILDKCFIEAKRYIRSVVGFQKLKETMTRLYFNVDETGNPVSLKDSVLKYPKLCVPIVKYFSKEYHEIYSKITNEQMFQMIQRGDPMTLDDMYYYDPKFLTKELENELNFQMVFQRSQFNWLPNYVIDNLVTNGYSKRLLSQKPYFIKYLFKISHLFRGEKLERLASEVPEISKYLQKLPTIQNNDD